jgi:hypothetical protein
MTTGLQVLPNIKYPHPPPPWPGKVFVGSFYERVDRFQIYLILMDKKSVFSEVY